MNPKRPKKVKRVVLGVGHPWFWKVSLKRPGYQTVRLYAGNMFGEDAKRLTIGDLGQYNRIRLVAEVLE